MKKSQTCHLSLIGKFQDFLDLTMDLLDLQEIMNLIHHTTETVLNPLMVPFQDHQEMKTVLMGTKDLQVLVPQDPQVLWDHQDLQDPLGDLMLPQ